MCFDIRCQMRLVLKNTVDNMVSRNRTGTSILREFINGLIVDQNILANSNAEIFLDKNPIIDKAVRGKE